MSTITSFRKSSLVSNVNRAQDFPVLKASSMDEKFIEFVTAQAVKPAGANLVKSTLEAHLDKGEKLDSVLWQILAIARATCAKHPEIASVFH
ncbi:MAG: hypothetical protein Q7S87_09665 [Agitococcus sp.]|nr:hypothetical protein [Agitococcus sp.]MDO9179228.1 hypothetical protein [Agitococcus sp.]